MPNAIPAQITKDLATLSARSQAAVADLVADLVSIELTGFGSLTYRIGVSQGQVTSLDKTHGRTFPLDPKSSTTGRA